MVSAIHNAVFGMAYGDSWGAITEFKQYDRITQAGVIAFPEKARITDDTQMALYALQGITIASKHIKALDGGDFSEENIRRIRVAIANQFMIWLHDPRNNRAPGRTCLTALSKLKKRKQEISHIWDRRKLTGIEGTQAESKGCGANMRNPWFGFLPYSDDTIEELSLIQAEITHSHPLAYSSSALTALAVKALRTHEVMPVSGQPRMLDWLIAKTTELHYHNNTSGRGRYDNGLVQMADFLDSRKSLYKATVLKDSAGDLCELISSEGWVAEEALLLACLAIDLHADNPVATLERSVRTNGDSDSIAAIAGAMAGAYMVGDWPKAWVANLEADYREELYTAADTLTNMKKLV